MTLPPPAEKPEKTVVAETGLQRVLDYEHRIYADRCETHMMMDNRHTNRHNGLHGGMIAILLDSACGFAASRALSDDANQLVSTLSLTTNYVALAKHPHIYAIGKTSRAGRSVVYVNGEVFDGNGTLIATGSSVLKKVK